MDSKYVKSIIFERKKINEKISNKENSKKEIINILQNILKAKLDTKILNLEKNTKEHFSMLNITSYNAKYLSNLALKLNKEIKNNAYNKKKSKFSQSVKKLSTLNIRNNNKNILKNFSTFSPKRAKTNIGLYKSEKKSNNFFQRFPTEPSTLFLKNIKNKSRNKNNNNKIYLKSPISFHKFGNKSKLNSYINTTNKKIGYNIKKGNILHTRNHYSIDSTFSNITSENSSYLINNKNNVKSLKYKRTSIEQISNKKNNKNKKIGLIGKLKRSIDKSNDKNSPNKKPNLSKNKNKIEKKLKSNKKNSVKKKNSFKHKKSNNIKNKKSLTNKDEITVKLEFNLNHEENLINKDPLLIDTMKDLEFLPKELESINISRDELNIFINKNKDSSFKSQNDKLNNSNKIILKHEFRLENINFEDYFKSILIFLSISDIIRLKNCSKAFHFFIINYLLTSLNIERKSISEKINNLNLKENEKPKKLEVKNIALSKGTQKAIILLNDEVFTRIFFEQKKPNKEILFAYKIYFQLINDKEIKISNENLTNNILWEKIKAYFQKYNGKISNELINNIKEEKILITGDNLYKIYKLIEHNIDKLNPGYFSKICGTTSLFIFYIKDILDFLGFTNEKKFVNNSFWSHFEIINYLDSKIKSLDSFSKNFNFNEK